MKYVLNLRPAQGTAGFRHMPPLSSENAVRFQVHGGPKDKTAFIGRINPLPTKDLEEAARLGGAVDTGKWYIQRFYGDQCGACIGGFETKEEALEALAEEINS